MRSFGLQPNWAKLNLGCVHKRSAKTYCVYFEEGGYAYTSHYISGAGYHLGQFHIKDAIDKLTFSAVPQHRH